MANYYQDLTETATAIGEMAFEGVWAGHQPKRPKR
ncbi:hypothetical protein CCACVL1_16692 [Corchorus capsularis]|uniref:Uncharacterized protein n=1 Tax=Corchorus capsularis TaxID=210143 RepID=A0A1R3HW27_COCAP|nr:hypothetical protein CCACVL1_16692 [Corchorus capsularis]